MEMTPWTRVDQALSAQRHDWNWLASTLVQKIQTLNHWQTRGIPAKHHAAIEDALGKPRGWVLDGVEDEPKRLSDMAEGLAALFDMIPKTDHVKRSRAYAVAWDAIRRELPPDVPSE